MSLIELDELRDAWIVAHAGPQGPSRGSYFCASAAMYLAAVGISALMALHKDVDFGPLALWVSALIALLAIAAGMHQSRADKHLAMSLRATDRLQVLLSVSALVKGADQEGECELLVSNNTGAQIPSWTFRKDGREWSSLGLGVSPVGEHSFFLDDYELPDGVARGAGTLQYTIALWHLRVEIDSSGIVRGELLGP